MLWSARGWRSGRYTALGEALRLLSDAGVLLATVNYDGLLEASTGLPAVSWREPVKVERVLRGDARGILHLHGYWEDPQSIVLGARSYDEVSADPHARAVLTALRVHKTFVFVGHGAGPMSSTTPTPTSPLLSERGVEIEEGEPGEVLMKLRDGSVVRLTRAAPSVFPSEGG